MKFRAWLSSWLHPEQSGESCQWPTREELHDDFEARVWDHERIERELSVRDPRLAAWLGTINASGHVRERALRQLIERYQPGDENRILLLLADWVPQVRTVASAWVLQHFATLPTQALFIQARLLVFLFRKRHLAHVPALLAIQADLVGRLLKQGPPLALGFDRRFREYLYGFALADGRVKHAWIAADPEPSVRMLLLSATKPVALSTDVSDLLGRDRAVRVRRMWLERHLASGETPDRSLLEAFAFDKHRGIRALARFHFERAFGVDVHALYANADGDDRFFIADLHRLEDLPLFLEMVESDRSAVRELGLRAICACSPESLLELDPRALLQDVRRVRLLAHRHLPQVLSLQEVEGLGDVLDEPEFLAWVLRKSVWRFLHHGLDALARHPTDPKLVEQLWGAAKKTEPTPPLAADLRTSLITRAFRLAASDQDTARRLGKQLLFVIRTAPEPRKP